MIQMTGAEFKRFYDDPVVWPADAYWEDGVIVVDGREDVEDLRAISDTSKVKVQDGEIYCGNPIVPSAHGSQGQGGGLRGGGAISRAQGFLAPQMSDSRVAVNEALSFGAAHLEALCAEAVAWKEGHHPCETLSELARLCAIYIGGGSMALDAAAGIVSRLAMESIANRTRRVADRG